MPGTLGMQVKVKPIPDSACTTLVKRPHYSVLDKGKVRYNIDYEIPHWRDSLNNKMSQLWNIK